MDIRRTFPVSVLLPLLLLAGCGSGGSGSQQDDNDGEVPPIPILGSGVLVFQYDTGTISCTQSTQNSWQVVCQAMVPASELSTGIVQFETLPATVFDPRITLAQWQPLQVSWSSGSTSVPDPVVSENGTNAVYTLPQNLPSGENLQVDGTLLLEATDSSGDPEEKEDQSLLVMSLSVTAM